MTDRLSPTDAAFLYSEDATTPMHVGGVVVLHPTGGFDFQRVLELVDSRLSLVPRYRQKVRLVPGRLARPVWVDDDGFDITYHVRRSALPRPGTREQLDELVGRLISRPLDRSRPLWELYIVEGLEGGRVALVNKTHETMVDRVGAVDVAAAILDLTRAPRELPSSPWIPVPAPSEADLVVDAVSDLTARPTEVLDTVRLAGLDLRSTLGGLLDAGLLLADVLLRTMSRKPPSPLTVRAAAPRRFATASADLAQVKAIRGAHGGSVNDVILAVLAGALRSWLLSRGDPVSVGTSPQALVPVSVQGETTDDPDQVSSFVVELPVSEPSPVMRLHQVSFAMTAVIESGRPIGAATLLGLGRLAPATLHAMGARVAGQLSRRSYDLLVTNVPGPQVRLYAAGIPVEEMYPIPPLVRGHAIAVACTSYHGRVFFGVTSDRDAMPEVEEFGLLIGEALAELLDTVPTDRPRRSPDRARRASTPLGPHPDPAAAGDRSGTLRAGRMRVYVPTTVAGLRAAVAASAVTPVGGLAFAVTPSLRAEYQGADDEEFEYLAMHDAAVASLRLIAADGTVDGLGGGREDGTGGGTNDGTVDGPGSEVGVSFGAPMALRVVVAADVDTAEQRPDLDRAVVLLSAPVPWSAVAAVHLDSADAGAAVRAAASVVDRADLGDPDTEFVLGAAEDIDLCWFHPSEVSFLISEL